ncbi:MAG: helix-turn-helix domain-containing protein [Clostridia bacterium]|nr:helix-turn-helix domain-containing protein [Clostridia bacterium]
MSKKLFQNLVLQIREVIDWEFGITDDTGTIIACSDEDKVGQAFSFINEVLEDKNDIINFNGFHLKKIFIKGKLEFISFIASDHKESEKYLFLISMNILNIKNFYDEKFDKGSFLKSILTGSVLPGDISVKSRELHITHNIPRVVILINIEKSAEVFAHEIVQELFPNKSKDFIILLDNENVVLIKELKNAEDTREIEKTAQTIIDTLSTESMVKAMIGIGTVVDSITDIGRSFKEAHTALEVGGIFESNKSVINYNNLGIGRLIYQLPESLCRLFLKEVFKSGSFESLDSEYILTIQKFFENNLNVSETSRQMFVHRNTLVYRLDKIQKVTGLDITKFDDAIILKFAMLVKKYLDKNHNEDTD